jgi:protein-tyrosine phosphatase
MIDIHAHILPGLDDGPESLEKAVAICTAAAVEGTTAIVATPHQRHESWENSDPVVLEAARATLQKAVGDSITIALGGEVRWDGELLDDLDRPGRGGVQTLAGSRYLLLEPGVIEPRFDPVELIHELSLAGYLAVVAHVERVPHMAGDPGLIRALVDGGAFLQLTAGSLSGVFGRKPQAAGERMLDAGLVHFVASDAHDLDRRPARLGEAYRLVERRWGGETALALFVGNPTAVLEDRDLRVTVKAS